MKNKPKRLLTLVMSAVLTLSSVTISGLTAHSESQQNNEAVNSDVKVSGSIGSLLSEELEKAYSDNDGNIIKDYVIHDFEFDPATSMINICYGAKTGCTLFIGFYNDDCTELIYSKAVNIEENYIGNVETVIPRKLPDYYLIKCFIVDDMKRPLCKAKSDDTHTKALQDILKKKYDDEEFDQNNVVFFDKNDKNNFFVSKRELHSITSTDDADHYIEDVEAEENGEYSFEKIDKIAQLKNGDEVVVYTASQYLLFIIDNIKIDGDKATIKSKDCELEDLCDFIKLDASTLPSAKAPTIEVTDEFKEKYDGMYEVIENPDEILSDKEGDTKKESENPFELTLDSPQALSKEISNHLISSFTFSLDAYKEPDGENGYALSGQVQIYNDLVFELYLSAEYKSFRLEDNCNIYLQMEGSFGGSFPLIFTYTPIGFIIIKSSIDLNVEISGRIFATCNWNTFVEFGKDGVQTDSSFVPEIKGVSGQIRVYWDFPVFVMAVTKKIAEISVRPKVGFKYYSDSTNDDANPDTHPCGTCIPGEVYFFGALEGEAALLALKLNVTLIESDILLGKTYNSDVLGFGWGECPNKGRSVSLSPVDKVVNPFEIKSVDPTDTDTATGSVGERGYVNKSKYPDLKYDIHGDGSVYIDGEGEFSTFTPTEERNKGTLTKIIFTDPNTIVKGIPHNQPIETVDLRQTKMANAYITFMSHDNLKNVYFPDTLESMDYYTFAECHNLEKIDLPPNLTNIGRFAFQNCTSLKEIELPSKVKNIGLYAFYGCKNLATFKTNDALETIGESAFAHSGITSIVIPESIKKIDGSAFSGSWGSSENLKSVTINGDYEGELTFSGLKSLESVKFGDKVTKINEMAFHGCSNITELEIPENIKTIEYAAFGGLDNLKSVTINGDYEGTSTFSGLKSLESVKFGNKVTKINKKDFYGCTNIAEIEIPENITTIGNSAFYNTGLKKVVIPESITQIDDAAFSACKSLTDIYILNPTAKFNSNIISGYSNIRIHGYKGSTAEKLGETGKNANIFIPFENDDPTNIEGIHTSTGHSDNTSTTPKMEYEYAGGEPDKEYIFMIVPESDTEEPDIDNAIYIDQKTSDADGNVTFTFNKPADENVSYIIIGETNSKENDDIQQEPIDNSEENITPEKTTTLYGDSNGDGKVDMSDAVLIMQMMANPNKFQVSPEFMENADVYQTGTGITTMDALSIQKYLLGLIPSLPEK